MVLSNNSTFIIVDNKHNNLNVLFAKISSVFKFQMLILYGSNITPDFSMYLNTFDIVEFNTASTNHDVINDTSYKIRKLTNNIDNLNVGIAKKDDEYYLYINKSCTIFIYALMGGCPITFIIPIDELIYENFDIVQALNKEPYQLDTNKQYVNLIPGFITQDTTTNLLFYNIKNTNSKANLVRFQYDFSILSSNIIKVKYSSNTDIIKIIGYDSGGFCAELTIPIKVFTYNEVKYYRIYPVLHPLPTARMDTPKIYYDDEFVYITGISGRVTYINLDYSIQNSIDISKMKEVKCIIESTITDDSKSDLSFDNSVLNINKNGKTKTVNDFVKLVNGQIIKIKVSWNTSTISLINNGNRGFIGMYLCVFKLFKEQETTKKLIYVKNISNINTFSLQLKFLYNSEYLYIQSINNTQVFIGDCDYEIIKSDTINTLEFEEIPVLSDMTEDVSKLDMSKNPFVNGCYTFDMKTQKLAYFDKSEYVSNKWKDVNGNDINAKSFGTFEERPTSGINKGFLYFCTNKLTIEGKSNGIMIYFAGDTSRDIWVDALGRKIN